MLWLLESGLVAIARLLLYLRLLGQVTNLFPQLTRRLSAGEPHARVRGPCAQFGGMGLPLDLSEPEDLGESGPFEERSAPRTKADLLREIRQRADRRTGQQEAEQRQIDPWQAQPPQRRGHGR